MKIDINCDMGEGFGLYSHGNDDEMLKYISSVNIACGFHAGDPHVMRETVKKAKEYDIAIGAHPGFPDLLGFGRRKMTATMNEVKDYITYQVGALNGFAHAYDVKLQHVKPHGALYMQAMEDREIARAVLESIAEIDDELIVFAVNNSEVIYEATKMGIPVVREAYADREHTEDGSLVLTRQGPAINDYKKLADRVVRMVKEKKVLTFDGKDVAIEAETVCIHGDTAGADLLAKAVVEALEKSDIEIVPAIELVK